MKRFYEEVAVASADGGWQVTLDGRGVKTPAKHAQLVPSAALAEALAEEWRKQGEELDPKAMPMRDLADYAIDQVAKQRRIVAEKLVAYAETDTLAYRARPDDPVLARQEDIWEPILTAFEAEHGVTLPRVSGIMHAQLSEDVGEALVQALGEYDPFALAALEMLTSLAASLSVGWTALTQPERVVELFDAANLEQDIQAEEWGWDQEAEEARASKSAAFAMAATFARLTTLR